MRRRVAVDIGKLRHAMPEEHPWPPRAIHLNHGKIVVRAQFPGQRAVEIGRRFLPCAVGINAQSDPTRLIQPCRFLLDQETGILAPVESALIPRCPQAPLLVACQADVRFKSRRRRHRDHVAPLAVGIGPHDHVVIAFVVGVPGHVDFARAVGGDGRLPVIGRRRRHLLRRRPHRAVVAPRKNVRPAVAESLPDQPQVPVRIGGELMVDIGLRVARQPLHRRPGCALQPASIEVPVAVDLRRPHHPRESFLIAAHPGEKDIARLGRDFLRRLPGRAVEAAHENVVGSFVLDRAAEGDPAGPHFAVRPAQHGGVIVFILGSRDHLRRRDAVDHDAAPQHGHGLSGVENPRRHHERALPRLHLDGSGGGGFQVHDDAG